MHDVECSPLIVHPHSDRSRDRIVVRQQARHSFTRQHVVPGIAYFEHELWLREMLQEIEGLVVRMVFLDKRPRLSGRHHSLHIHVLVNILEGAFFNPVAELICRQLRIEITPCNPDSGHDIANQGISILVATQVAVSVEIRPHVPSEVQRHRGMNLGVSIENCAQ